MALRKLKPVEAGDGSYGGLVLSAFDSLAELSPLGMDGDDVVASAEGASAVVSIDPQDLARLDELATQGTGLAGGRKVGEHLLTTVYEESVIGGFNPEIHKAKYLAWRKGLRDACRAIVAVPQGNKGGLDLIRRNKALAAIQALTPNGLAWGGIHDEKGPEQK
jgi:hypothetical protein